MSHEDGASLEGGARFRCRARRPPRGSPFPAPARDGTLGCPDCGRGPGGSSPVGPRSASGPGPRRGDRPSGSVLRTRRRPRQAVDEAEIDRVHQCLAEVCRRAAVPGCAEQLLHAGRDPVAGRRARLTVPRAGPRLRRAIVLAAGALRHGSGSPETQPHETSCRRFASRIRVFGRIES